MALAGLPDAFVEHGPVEILKQHDWPGNVRELLNTLERAYLLGAGHGEWVLVMGATGGLASCCVQVAELMGAKVIAAAGSDERVQIAQEFFGAHHGVNYRTQDLAAEVMKITDGHGADVVAENVGDPEQHARQHHQ